VVLRKCHFILIFILLSSLGVSAGVEWYEPSLEGIDSQGRAKVTVSGEAEPGAKIVIDLSKVIVIRGPQRGKKLSPESASALVNDNGLFDLKAKLPKGLLQVPVLVKGSDTQTILVLFDISDSAVKLNVKTKKRPEKAAPPPVVAKAPPKKEKEPAPSRYVEEKERERERPSRSSGNTAFNLRVGVGGNYQKVTQKQEGANELAFQNIQFPSAVVELGIEGKNLSGEIGYQTHPSAVTQAEAPFTLLNGKANWQIINADLFWRMGERSAKLGPRFRVGAQSHRIPFLTINQSNQVSLVQNTMLGVAIGYGSKFGDPQGWSYDAMLSYIHPISYDSPELKSFSLLPKLGLEFNLGINRKVSDLFSWGAHWTAEVQNHGFSYKDAVSSTNYNGELSIFMSIFTLDVGLSF
jgi:hypothetical protein